MAHATYADNQLLGIAGEGFATGVYEGAGYELVESRARTRSGEIDIVLEAPDGAAVFVEVKTRRGAAFGAAEAVTPKKLRTMRRCAAEWLEGKGYRRVRLDVAEVLFSGADVAIEIYEDVDDGAC
ncbi:YraN family protein [Corynebacterium sp. UBA2622]|uniref:YraN family protein n=1 Tax=Corynebacterium sp. UBA2622 TaxID=1946393 RepID=UPI0025C3D37E|nr:YraN family protein [Corynebacterium sp. UBA2622]